MSLPNFPVPTRPLARKLSRGAAACVVISGMVLAPIRAFPEDIEPKASPDRLEDVPSTRPDPFPAFNNFSWRAFIALAWPALTEPARRGEPDRSKNLADPGPRVWETFKSRYEIFQPGPNGGATAPPIWGSYDGQNPCGRSISNRIKTLDAFETYSDFNQATFSPGAFAGPLVAQNRTYTRYEVRVNELEYKSIVNYKWYRREFLPTFERPEPIDVGSIAVKAAWRILTDIDTPAVRDRYYVVKDAEVLDVAKSRRSGANVCSRQDIALVGLHIFIKTRYRPQGIWSSFEQIDNVPPIGTGDAREPDAKDAQAPYSYSDPLKSESNQPNSVGSPAAQPVSETNPPDLDPEPAQVVRRHPISAETMAINRAYWALPEIRDTVWSHYMLVVTQWPTITQPEAPSNDGAYFPGTPADKDTPAEVYQLPGNGGAEDRNLANTTMETYFQDPPASCMACHHAVSNAFGRDFVAFVAHDAR